MPIVYCVAAHDRPAQLRRLIDLLVTEDPACHVVLHYDHPDDPFEPGWTEARSERLTVLARRAVHWGTFDLVELFVEFMATARRRPDCSMLVFLSGRDYPVTHLGGLEATLGRFDVWAEDTAITDDAAPRHHRARYSYRWHCVDGPSRLERRVYGVSRRLLPDPEFDERPHPLVHLHQGDLVCWGWRTRRGPGRPVYAGSQWMSLSARAVDGLLDAFDSQTAVVDYFRHTPVPDEACFLTLLRTLPGLSRAPGNARFIRWRPRSGHPETLTTGDLPGLLAAGDHFARKFDEEVDSQVMDALDMARRSGDARR